MLGLDPMILILSRLEANQFIHQRTTPGCEQEFVEPGVGERGGFDRSGRNRLVKLLHQILAQVREPERVVG